jgi:hypothetical protein
MLTKMKTSLVFDMTEGMVMGAVFWMASVYWNWN